ncbi:porin [Sphingobacterium hotanense]|uniref:porin n=1 Tax=Sphingobacterium hotanense TaxID=649196 RepID=UPI0021A5ADBA|nr:porin [Sphingobacterium hotanense]MCT1525013.1 porin [Sphingobacterium hotanense]
MEIKGWLAGLCCFSATALYAQDDKNSLQSKLSLNGYLEAYYTYDFQKPSNHQKASFIYSHNRSDEFAVNLAMLRATYQSERVRSQVALAAGSYMNANYAAEEGVYKMIYEANVGYKLSSKSNFWIEAGIMPSHIGPESAIGIDNISLTRSISAENSPYFETGAKLSYQTANEKWSLAILAINGWQRIQLPESSRGLSFGHQVQYRPSKHVLLNSSSYIGNEGPDSLRIFHDFFVQVDATDRLRFLGLVDYAIRHISNDSRVANYWTAGLQAQYRLLESLNINARFEYFNDADGIIFGSIEPIPSEIMGLSSGFDLHLFDGLFWRAEFRYLRSDAEIFKYKAHQYKSANGNLTTALTWRF